MVSQHELRSLWGRVVELVKLQVSHPSFYKAIELAIPITTEDSTFVVGFAPVNLYMAGHLNVSEHKNAIEKTIQELTGVKYTVRIIEGENIQDWETVKEKDERRRMLRESEGEHKKIETASQKAWEKLLVLAGRRYAALPNRGMPQYRAKYVAEMLDRMSEAIDELMIVDGDKVDELGERHLSRIIERIAQLAEIEPTVLGLELHRLRESKK